MRKESSTLQKCKRQMATLGFDSQLAYHRVKPVSYTHLAKFAFSMFWRAMRFAEEQQVPILLDY